MDDYQVILLDDDEPVPSDAVVVPALTDMEPEEAVRWLMEGGLDEVDARFHLAIARGEIDGDAYAVDDNGKRVRTHRHNRAPARHSP